MKKTFSIILLIIILMIVTYLFYINSNRLILVSQNQEYQENIKSGNDNDKHRLSLLTYNIRHGVGMDGRLDLDRLAKVIKKSGADIIGLNEVDFAMSRSGFKNQVRYLAEKIGMNYAFGASVEKITGSYGNAILSKYPIDNAQNYILPALKSVESETRSLLKVEVDLPGTNNPLYIMSTHLALNKNERSEQIRWIEEMLSTVNCSYILMGDFNTDIQEVLYTISKTDLDYDGLKPILKEIKTYPATNPSKGIDLYLSASPVELINAYAINSNASDHLPVYLELDIYS